MNYLKITKFILNRTLEDVYEPSSFSNDDRTVRHSLEINVFRSINWIKSCTVIISNRRSRKCYKYRSIRWTEFKSNLITVLGDLRTVRNKRDREVGSSFNCSCKSDNK